MDFLENCGLRPIYTNKNYMNSVKSNLKYYNFDMSKFNLVNKDSIESSTIKLNNKKLKKNKKPILFNDIYKFILNNIDNQYNVDIKDFTSSESESEHDSEYEYYSD